MNHRRDIDGLRGVAIIPVVLFHAGVPGFTGGFVGVDVFFVISGYLITGLLKGRLDAGRLSLSDFYERRIRRIFPALFVVLGFVVSASLILFLPIDLDQFGRSCLATLVFGSNIFFYSKSGYFGAAADVQPLWHMWSLSVEEQFYFFFPLMMIGLYRWRPAKLIPALRIIVALSFMASSYAAFFHPKAAFYMMPLRIWELGIGALLALDGLGSLPVGFENRWAGVIGLLSIAVPIVLYTQATPFPGFAGLVPVAGTALLLRDRPMERDVVGRCLEAWPLRCVGLISYSLYLWHWPILVFAKYRLYPQSLDASATVASIGLAVFVAALSWRFVEQPFRRPSSRVSRRRVFQIAGALTAVLAGVSAIMVVDRGIPSRVPDAARWDRFAKNFDPRARGCTANSRHPATARSCVFGDESHPPTFAIWGDSFAGELAAAIGDLLRPRGQSILQIGMDSCPPALDFSFTAAFGSCVDRNASAIATLTGSDEIGSVVLAANYALYQGLNFKDAFEAGMRGAVDRLLDAGKTVWIVYPIPAPKLDVPRVIALDAMRGKDPAGFHISMDAYRADYASTITFLDSLLGPDVHKIDLTSRLCTQDYCSTLTDKDVLYVDNAHLSTAGAHYVAPAFSPMLTE